MLKQELAQQFGKYIVDDNERFKEKIIGDYPFMITEDGWVVCIPSYHIDNSFTCGIAGMSGSGKSLVLHRLTGCLFWAGKNVCMLNDSTNETLDWCQPQDYPPFITEINVLKQSPVPLPIIYVFPNTVSLKMDEEKMKDKNYVRITIPFPEILNKINSFVKAINPEAELGQSSMYLKNMIEKLSKCETEDDVKGTIEREIDNIPTTHKEGLGQMKYKILNAFETIFGEKIADISAQEAHSRLSYGKFLGNPFSTLMLSQVIPSFMTSDLYNKKYKSEILAYHIKALFDNQTLDKFRDAETYIAFDELTKICSTEDKNIAEKEMANIVARGRHFRLGMLYATQNYEKIPNIIRNARLDYFIAFKQRNHEVIRDIIKDCSLSKDNEEIMKNLKPLECLAITHKKFICYRGDEIKEETGVIRGKVIPPLSKHRKTG